MARWQMQRAFRMDRDGDEGFGSTFLSIHNTFKDHLKIGSTPKELLLNYCYFSLLSLIIYFLCLIFTEMAEIQEYKQNITDNLNNLQNLINKSPLFNTDQTKWRNQIVSLTKQIRKNLLYLEEQVKELPTNQASHYVGSIKSFKKKLEKLENDTSRRQRGDSNMADLIQRPQIIQTPQEKRMNAIQEVMKKGDDAQEQTKASLRQMNQMVQRGIQMAADINIELNKQIQQLDRMNDKVKDTGSTLKKAQKNIVYFMRAMECDMCMAGLLVMILLALVAVIVLAVKKNQK